MIRFVQTVNYFQFGVIFTIQFIMLYLQYGAFRRHRQRCFVLLLVSTVSGIASAAITLELHLFPAHLGQFVWLFPMAFALFFAQAVPGVFGAATLFRDYRRLAEGSSKANDQSGTA